MIAACDDVRVWPVWLLAVGLGLLGTACGLLLLSAAMLVMRI